MPHPADILLDAAREEGFDLAGITPAEPPPDAEAFDRWLAEGRDAPGIAYLRRNRERILDPRRLLRGARSLLVLGVGFAREAGGFRGGGKVSRYALGRDYHRVIGGMLRRLVARLRREKGLGAARTVVDAGPVLERSHGRRAGLGFLGKSANLLDDSHGPWFFLAEAITDLDAEERARTVLGSCGTCTRCIDACPTGAIVEPFVVDANRCISYLTIEHRGSIPEELRPLLGEWVFGCDVCSEVCPYGDAAPDGSARFGTHPALEFSLADLLALDEARFAKAFEGSAIRRAKRAGLARNAAVALGNRRDPDAAPALARAASADPDPVVREHAAWALSRLDAPSPRGGAGR